MGGFESAVERIDRTLDGPLTENERFTAERQVLEAFYGALREDDVVWDVGARDGLYTLLATDRVGTDGVVAFERDRRHQQDLIRNLRLAGVRDVEVCPATLVEDLNASRTGRRDAAAGPVYPASEVVDLSPGIVSPTVVKIDAGGREAEILAGFSETQLREIRELFVAAYDRSVVRKLEAAGFDVSVVEERPGAGNGWTSFVRSTGPADSPISGVRASRDTSAAQGPPRGDTQPASETGSHFRRDETADRPGPRAEAASRPRSRHTPGGAIGLVRRFARRVGAELWKTAAAVFHYVVSRLFIVALLVGGMAAFFALSFVLVIVLSPLGVSDRTIGAVAGATVLLTPWVLLARHLLGK